MVCRSVHRLIISIFTAAASVMFIHASGGDPTTEPAVDVHMREPADELATIVLPPGYHLELVASDPDIICPVLCEWDGDGRMYVAEMRSYMLDINGTKAHTPISRVSRWEQTKGDGVYDKHTIYADGLMLPRMVLPLDDRVLIRETDTKDIWCYRDTTGTGVADQKNKIYEGGKQEGNLEHQPSGLLWNIDNWIYVTAQDERFRFTRGKMEKEPIPFRGGQWGIAATDTGQLIFNRAGAEQSAYAFQVMPQYGEIALDGERVKGFDAVYPIEHLTDVEGGTIRLWPGGGVNHFTGCAGPCIYRGDALPELRGDYILPEPVGRLIRRAKMTQVDGKHILTNAYDHDEFIKSTDPNFRPVWAATGPDGYLYFCDMYHGIIQEANWTKEGTYLRPQIKKYGLQKNIGKGRIWRLVADGSRPHVQPHMLEETTAQLVAHLSDSNGWWRDTAQKMIILRGDKSVVPELENLARAEANPITRLHALWTLEGLDAVTDSFLVEKLKDTDPAIRNAAVRIAEPLMAKKDTAIAIATKALATDPDPTVAWQVCLSLLRIKATDADAVVTTATATTRPTAAATENVKSIVGKYKEALAKKAADEAKDAEMKKLDAAKGELFAKGRGYYGQTCIACHAADGMGMPTPEHNGSTLAPPLKGSRKLLSDRQLIGRIVLHGLTGPNNGKTYPGQMASFKFLPDDWIAAVLTYARNDWGNKADVIRPEDVATIRKLTADRDKPFTLQELYAAVEATAPVTSTGARVVAKDGEIILDPSTVQLHGNGIRVDCYPSGLDIGFWDDWQNWVSWSIPQIKPGDYRAFARTSSPDGVRNFRVQIDGQFFTGATTKSKAWDQYKDIDLGVVHIERSTDVPVEFHPADAEHWGPSNLADIKLVPISASKGD